MNCPICTADNEEILWRNDKLRVIAVHNDANFPAPIWAAAQRPSATVLPADWPQQVRVVLQKEAV